MLGSLTSNSFKQLVISFFKFSSARVTGSFFKLHSFLQGEQVTFKCKDNLRNSAYCQNNVKVRAERWI